MARAKRAIPAAVLDDSFVQLLMEELTGRAPVAAPAARQEPTASVGLEALHKTMVPPQEEEPAQQPEPARPAPPAGDRPAPVRRGAGLHCQVRAPRVGAPDWVLPLKSTPLTIGRLSQNSVVLQCPQVSRKHARLWVDKFGLRIDDLGSTNGTWVNGTKVPAAYLQAGDVIKIGTMNFYIEDAGPDVRPAS